MPLVTEVTVVTGFFTRSMEKKKHTHARRDLGNVCCVYFFFFKVDTLFDCYPVTFIYF